MLQQNSYFPSRYTGWINTSYSSSLARQALIFVLCALLTYNLHYIVLAVIVTAALAVNAINAVKVQKKSIKKLVFTGRIKRLYTCAALILAVLILAYCLSPENVIGKTASIICLAVSLVTPILTYAAWGVTCPIEKSISRWYVNDAKRILKEHKNLTVIGITGSYGKTTTKFILTRILSEKYNVVCTPQSFNTPMGVVRTIREGLKPQTQIFVCEMGAKNIGDIKEICDIVHPDYGIITSVGAQHLETFKTVENVFNTKFELADAVNIKGGQVFVNGDSKEIADRIGNRNLHVYGTNEDLEFSASSISYGRNGSEFEIDLGKEKLKLSTKLLGLHSIVNIIGASALAYSLGVSASDIQYAVASLKATEHRLELKGYINGSLLIDDAYNANPEGCLEAVRVLGSFEGMKKVIVTPGLIELGEKEYDCNYALGLEAAKYCDIIILVGKNRSKPMADAVGSTNFNKENLHIVSSFKEAMSVYSPLADSNTVVLFENDLPDNYLN